MEFLDEILEALQSPNRFVRLTLSGPVARSNPWQKIVVQPVVVASERVLQAVMQGERKQIRRTLAGDRIASELQGLLARGFRHIDLQCSDGDLHIRITKKGRALVSRGKPSVTVPPCDAAHDHRKEYPFPEGEPSAFLDRLGIMRGGRVIASMRDKFRQINQFLILLGHIKLVRSAPTRPLSILDCGCGRAFLSFATCHYLRHRLGLEVSLVGVDADHEVIETAMTLRGKLRLEGAEFVQTAIRDYRPPKAPDIVLSLHACDTATDEAIALGVRCGARVILCVPCCQHEFHRRMSKPDFRGVLRHGILRERMADILTDALRASALRAMGYRADVIEFISPGHTAKNLMIRAEKVGGIRKADAAREYMQLRDEFLNARPCIEKLLGSEFVERLQRCAP